MDSEALDRALGLVPRYMVKSVRDYLEGCPPGSFLRKVLENDLHGAALCADKANRAYLFRWACVLDALPENVWGNKEKVDSHLTSRREARYLASQISENYVE